MRYRWRAANWWPSTTPKTHPSPTNFARPSRRFKRRPGHGLPAGATEHSQSQRQLAGAAIHARILRAVRCALAVPGPARTAAAARRNLQPFSTKALLACGGWDPFNVTEDADLGIRLHRLGWQTGVIASTTYEEAPQRWSVWLPQRTRWLKGWMQTYLVHTRRLDAAVATPTVKGRRFTTAIGVHVSVGRTCCCPFLCIRSFMFC